MASSFKWFRALSSCLHVEYMSYTFLHHCYRWLVDVRESTAKKTHTHNSFFPWLHCLLTVCLHWVLNKETSLYDENTSIDWCHFFLSLFQHCFQHERCVFKSKCFFSTRALLFIKDEWNALLYWIYCIWKYIFQYP